MNNFHELALYAVIFVLPYQCKLLTFKIIKHIVHFSILWKIWLLSKIIDIFQSKNNSYMHANLNISVLHMLEERKKKWSIVYLQQKRCVTVVIVFWKWYSKSKYDLRSLKYSLHVFHMIRTENTRVN